MEITNHKTGHRASIHFKQGGWFGNHLHKLEGYLYDKKKKKLRAFNGKWVEALYSQDVKVYDKWLKGNGGGKSMENGESEDSTTSQGDDDVTKNNCDNNTDDDPLPQPPQHGGSTCDLRLPNQKLLWQATPKPEQSIQQYYSFTTFAMMLNEIEGSEHRAELPASDSRLRADIGKLEEADVEAASDAKHVLEEKQRAARKARKEANTKWTPNWFELAPHPQTGKEEWVYTGKYWDDKHK